MQSSAPAPGALSTRDSAMGYRGQHLTVPISTNDLHCCKPARRWQRRRRVGSSLVGRRVRGGPSFSPGTRVPYLQIISPDLPHLQIYISVTLHRSSPFPRYLFFLFVGILSRFAETKSRIQFRGACRRVGRIEHHERCLSSLVLVYFAHRMGSV